MELLSHPGKDNKPISTGHCDWHCIYFSSFKFPTTSYPVCIEGESLVCQDPFGWEKETAIKQLVAAPSPQTAAVPAAALP